MSKLNKFELFWHRTTVLFGGQMEKVDSFLNNKVLRYVSML
jgi:hypothetical protein